MLASIHRMYANTFKQQMSKHFSDVSALTTTNKERQKCLDAKEEPIRSKNFAKHFQSHFPKDVTPQ
eukprot:8958184-Ditylum_brightwellii.AAC.1